MPRQPNGEYVLPAGQPVETETIISSDVHNDLANDAAAALTDSLSRTGLGGMLVPFRVPDGSITLPSYSFTSAHDAGISYVAAQGWLNFSVAGILGLTISTDFIRSAIRFISPQIIGTNEAVATPLSTDHPIQAGLSSSLNVRIGLKGIQAVNNGLPADLRLNEYGGDIYVNGEPINGNVYDKDEYIDSSVGTPDAAKPIVLDAYGKVDLTMCDCNALVFIGGFTPEVGDEYPDTTGYEYGSFWIVEGLVGEFTFATGDLSGKTCRNGSVMIYGHSAWGLSASTITIDSFYRLDGAYPIIAPFAGGGQQIRNIADGTSGSDAATVGQLGDAVQWDDVSSYFDGVTDKVIGVNDTGHLDPSFLEINGFVLVDTFTPTSGQEYPDEPTGGYEYGQFWIIDLGTGGTYTWTGGSLAGQTGKDGQFLLYGVNGWFLFGGDVDMSAYVKKAGDTMSGDLHIPIDPASYNSAIPKTYADDNYLALTGQAADSLLFDGFEPSDFLFATGTAADSDLLEGNNAYYFAIGNGDRTVDDCDNMLHSGMFGTDQDSLNTPIVAGYGMLTVAANADIGSQQFTEHQTSSLWIRTWSGDGSVWGDWAELGSGGGGTDLLLDYSSDKEEVHYAKGLSGVTKSDSGTYILIFTTSFPNLNYIVSGVVGGANDESDNFFNHGDRSGKMPSQVTVRSRMAADNPAANDSDVVNVRITYGGA